MSERKAIIERRPVGPLAMNSYVIGCSVTKEAAIIDSGGETERMLALAQQHGLEITKLLQTHGHVDHVAGLKEMKEATSAPIYLHPDDAHLYSGASLAGMMFGLRVANPPPYDHPVADGEVITVGELSLTVIHTPGHCPGQVCYYERSAKALFCGDLIFAGSIGRVDLPGGSPSDMTRSLRRIMDELEDDVTIYPGHMGPTTVGAERRSNPFILELMR